MKKHLISLAMTSAVLTGCTSIAQKQTYGQFEQDMTSGATGVATDLAIKKAKVNPENGQAQNLLWSLEAGALLRMQKGYEQSNAFFDDAELLMKAEDTESIVEKGVDGLGAMAVNDTMMDYEQTHYDGIMANTYKAINFMFADDQADARVEWNRVDDRQRRAKDAFAKKIASLKEEQAKKAEEQKKAKKNTDKSLAEAEKLLQSEGVDLSEWEPYKDYVNPFSTYMHGLFFMVNATGNSDLNKAYDSFKRAAGMTNNPTVKNDLALADSLRRGKQSLKSVEPTVWVVFENGLGPKKEEIRIDLPVYVASNNLVYTGMALPKLVERGQAYPSLNVDGTKTTVLSEMDRIVQAEFKAEFPYILTREVARTVWKTIAQKQLNDQSPMAGLVAAVAQAATTGADLRLWNSLPKEFQLAKMTKPKDGELTITGEGMAEPLHVELDKNAQFNIVYIRAVSPLVAPAVDVLSI